LAFTGIRSDYDLMSGVYQELRRARDVEVGLVVSGAHLSERFGRTVRHIEADGIPIVARIESLIDSDSAASRLQSAAILLQACLHSVEAFHPDVVVYAGDREDVIVGALVGAYLGIPTAHFFGGDHACDGNVDNAVRHAATKLSTAHYVIHETHQRRLVRLGEEPDRVFVVGHPALDRFRTTPRMPRPEVLAAAGAPPWDRYAVVVHHPILAERDRAADQMNEILLALRDLGLPAMVGYPNSDAGGRAVIDVIRAHEGLGPIRSYRNLDRATFVNLLRHAAVMVGNSSAGILEAPMIPLGVVNVGERQRGRLVAENVVFVEPTRADVAGGIEAVLTPVFQARLAQVRSPYGDGRSTEAIVESLRTVDFAAMAYKRVDPMVVPTGPHP